MSPLGVLTRGLVSEIMLAILVGFYIAIVYSVMAAFHASNASMGMMGTIRRAGGGEKQQCQKG